MFQRGCLQRISRHLPSIKEVVEVLGPDVLDIYCRHGFLDKDAIARVEGVTGCLSYEEDEEMPHGSDKDDEHDSD